MTESNSTRTHGGVVGTGNAFFAENSKLFEYDRFFNRPLVPPNLGFESNYCQVARGGGLLSTWQPPFSTRQFEAMETVFYPEHATVLHHNTCNNAGHAHNQAGYGGPVQYEPIKVSPSKPFCTKQFVSLRDNVPELYRHRTLILQEPLPPTTDQVHFTESNSNFDDNLRPPCGVPSKFGNPLEIQRVNRNLPDKSWRNDVCTLPTIPTSSGATNGSGTSWSPMQLGRFHPGTSSENMPLNFPMGQWRGNQLGTYLHSHQKHHGNISPPTTDLRQLQQQGSHNKAFGLEEPHSSYHHQDKSASNFSPVDCTTNKFDKTVWQPQQNKYPDRTGPDFNCQTASHYVSPYQATSPTSQKIEMQSSWKPFRSQEPLPFRSQQPLPFRSQEPLPFRSQQPLPFRSQEPLPFKSQEPLPMLPHVSPYSMSTSETDGTNNLSTTSQCRDIQNYSTLQQDVAKNGQPQYTNSFSQSTKPARSESNQNSMVVVIPGRTGEKRHIVCSPTIVDRERKVGRKHLTAAQQLSELHIPTDNHTKVFDTFSKCKQGFINDNIPSHHYIREDLVLSNPILGKVAKETHSGIIRRCHDMLSPKHHHKIEYWEDLSCAMQNRISAFARLDERREKLRALFSQDAQQLSLIARRR